MSYYGPPCTWCGRPGLLCDHFPYINPQPLTPEQLERDRRQMVEAHFGDLMRRVEQRRVWAREQSPLPGWDANGSPVEDGP